jgi:hypothetical protein
MAWEDELFALLDDLEQQAEALYDTERGAVLADRSRAEYRQVTLVSRLMASLDSPVTLEVTGVGAVVGTLERVAAGWCLVGGNGQDWIVALGAVTTVRGASHRSVPEVAWPAVSRLELAAALRRLAETGERCVVHLVGGRSLDGTLARVGADFVEVRAGEQGQVVLVAFNSLAAVQSRD